MGGSDADLNLLFGALALQLDLIDPRQLAEVGMVWAARKDIPVSDLLCERGWITMAGREEVERLLRRKLARHGGDAHRSLASVTDARVAESLAGVDDPEVRSLVTEIGGGAAYASTLDYPAESRARYSLIRLHARGGLGRVWLARDPVLGRNVALKELLPERADEPAFRARFLDEARITGQLEHPGIVTIHELGHRPDDGRPFYTMRYVEGRTLSAAVQEHHSRREACSDHALRLSGLLNAFVAVCNAIAFVHSRGVIHRDLKGQNVILGDFGEVVVLDLGLAKLVARPEGERAAPAVVVERGVDHVPTLHGQPMGTPGYMAPEQAEGRHDLVGLGTDIYGLGAVLYEILTGRPPFETSASPDALRQVCERDPVPPRQVCAATPRALEAICLRALARCPADRYSSATELAEDVRRWLADEPVSAYAEPMTARWGRRARRHRGAVTVAVGLFLAAVAALALGAILLGRERARAEANARLLRDYIDQLYYNILANPLLDEPRMEPLRRDLIRAAHEYYRQLAARRRDDSGLLERLGWSYLRLARVTLQLGSVTQAIDQARLALDIFQALAADDPASDSDRRDLAQGHLDLGDAYQQAGRLREAEASFAAAVETWQELSARGGNRLYRFELASAYDGLGRVRLGLGQADRAAILHTEALAIWEDLVRVDPSPVTVAEALHRLANCLASLGGVHAARKEWGQAESSYRRARAIWEGLLRESSEATYRVKLAYTLQGLGKVRAAAGDPAEAGALFEQALSTWDQLAAADPAVVEYRGNRAIIHQLLGELHDPSLHPPGDPSRAESHYRQALDIWRTLPKADPQHPGVRDGQARALQSLGRFYRAAGKPDLAEAYLLQAREARNSDGVREEKRSKPSAVP